MKLEKGKLLVADPSVLNDSSFNRAIILLTEHTKNSSVGFILNKPLGYTINDLMPEINSSFTIYQGGPVEQDNLYFVHKIPELIPESIKIADGIYWGGNFNYLKKLLNNSILQKSEIRFFLGYSGWTKEQLEEEIKEKFWFIAENNLSTLFMEKENNLWKKKLLEKGGSFTLWANAPENYNLN